MTMTEAFRIAERLGAGPLRERIDRLAKRAGIALAATAKSEQEVATAGGPTGAGIAATPSGAIAGPEVLPVAPPRGPAIRLSPREIEVLRLVAEGRTNGEIGRELFVTTKTASSHVAHILDKLGASSRTEAAVVAERLGLLGRPVPHR